MGEHADTSEIVPPGELTWHRVTTREYWVVHPATGGVSFAIDVFSLDVFAAAVETVDDEPEIPSRRILETFAPDRFRSLRNVGVAVKALDMLRGLT